MGIPGFWYPQNQFKEQFYRSLQLKRERERKSLKCTLIAGCYHGETGRRLIRSKVLCVWLWKPNMESMFCFLWFVLSLKMEQIVKLAGQVLMLWGPLLHRWWFHLLDELLQRLKVSSIFLYVIWLLLICTLSVLQSYHKQCHYKLKNTWLLCHSSVGQKSYEGLIGLRSSCSQMMFHWRLTQIDGWI